MNKVLLVSYLLQNNTTFGIQNKSFVKGYKDKLKEKY